MDKRGKNIPSNSSAGGISLLTQGEGGGIFMVIREEERYPGTRREVDGYSW